VHEIPGEEKIAPGCWIHHVKKRFEITVDTDHPSSVGCIV